MSTESAHDRAGCDLSMMNGRRLGPVVSLAAVALLLVSAIPASATASSNQSVLDQLHPAWVLRCNLHYPYLSTHARWIWHENGVVVGKAHTPSCAGLGSYQGVANRPAGATRITATLTVCRQQTPIEKICFVARSGAANLTVGGNFTLQLAYTNYCAKQLCASTFNMQG